MNVCKKCGAPMIAGSKFCCQCGTAVDEPIPQSCPKCGSRAVEGAVFCNKCGARLTPLAGDRGRMPSGPRTLIVSRDAQFQCVANTYKVVVNGTVLGNVPAGGALRTRVASDIATVEIVCTTVLVKARKRLVLKLGENPRVAFSVQWPGTILESVHDAQILERQ